jgi:hypothetical protein
MKSCRKHRDYNIGMLYFFIQLLFIEYIKSDGSCRRATFAFAAADRYLRQLSPNHIYSNSLQVMDEYRRRAPCTDNKYPFHSNLFNPADLPNRPGSYSWM